MCVNQIFGISEKKTKHLGKYFSSIDFDVKKCSKQQLQTTDNKTIVGSLWINDKSQQVNLGKMNEVCLEGNLDGLNLPTDLTKPETDRIIETFINAKQVFWQKVRLNL